MAELYAGMRVGEESKMQNLLAGMQCPPVTKEIARRAGELKNSWSRRGRTFGLDEMIVAATALEHGLMLVTANRKDFPIEGLAFWPA